MHGDAAALLGRVTKTVISYLVKYDVSTPDMHFWFSASLDLACGHY